MIKPLQQYILYMDDSKKELNKEQKIIVKNAKEEDTITV